MRFDIMTLFPAMVEGVLSESIIGRARTAGILDIRTYNIREYSEDRRRRVDDTPCGGGRGMLMAAPPVWNCYRAVLSDGDAARYPNTKCIYLSPRGKTLTQETAKALAGCQRLILLCGHYEGIDQRVIDEIVDEEISIGDYVLTGGELAACILTDCVGRLIEGVLPEPECHEKESFENCLLEYPQYTRPIEYHGKAVPPVLLSGHHGNIDAWRLEQAEEITRRRRPDLYRRYEEENRELLEKREKKRRRLEARQKRKEEQR